MSWVIIKLIYKLEDMRAEGRKIVTSVELERMLAKCRMPRPGKALRVMYKPRGAK